MAHTTNQSSPPFRFSTFDVTPQVFYEGRTVLGLVNLKPIVPLHSLIIPREPYERLQQVPKSVLHELFEATQKVSTKLQELVGASSCTVSIQDGKDAVSSCTAS